jgi:hypothetical protein
MPGEERHDLTSLKALVEHRKWDWIPLLTIIPLLSHSLNRLLGKDPVFRRLGGFFEPLLEMTLLAAIGKDAGRIVAAI